ncbi:MAG: nitrite reductase large subunit NirB [Polyangiales bacterium]
MKERLVVVGNGMAGARFVEELVARGGNDRYEISIVGAEPYGNYNRILLSGVLAGTHAAKDVFLHPLAWYEKNGVTLHAGRSVTRIDREAKLIEAGDVVLPWDRLVLATGSSAFVPPILGVRKNNGTLLEGVHVFRTLDDCDAIRTRAERASRAIVIGGGLLGLEAARGLLGFGVEVHVVHLASHLMELQLDAAAGAILAKSLGKMGVRVHLARETAALVPNEREEVEAVVFGDGTAIEAELVVIATGIRPNAELARAAGIHVARGVVVDDTLTTSDPRVHAVGECAEHRNRLYGLVAPLWEQAKVLADRLVGRTPTYAGSKTSTKLKVAGIDLAVIGDGDFTAPGDEVVTYSEPSRGVYKKMVVREGRLAGAILLGDASAAPTLLQAFDRADDLPEERGEVLFPTRNTPAVQIEDLPDETQVCNCNGVTKGTIVAAVRGGKRSLEVLCDTTRAGRGCGSCKSQVAALLAHAADGMVTEDPSIHWYVPGVPLPKPELVREIRARELKSVSAVFHALANGKEDAASKPGLASLLKTMWGKEYVDERDARFVNDRVHANVQRDGTFSVIPRIYGGVTSAAQLRRIADVADKYDVPMVKITGGQRIDLLGIPKEKLPDVWRDLGMPSGHAYSKAFRTCKTCVGTEFCRYGVGDSTGLGVAIERRFQGLESPGKLKLATAGCPRNCSEATTKDIGAVAIEGGRWEIYVGGAAGSRVRRGDLLCTVQTQEDVLSTMGRFLQFYRERARYGERTFDFVERIGIDEIRRGMEEEAERLDAAMQDAVDAYVDPWLEADSPFHPTQFAGTIEPPPESEPRLVQLRRAGGER